MIPQEQRWLRRHVRHLTKLLREVFDELPEHTDGRYDLLEQRVETAERRSDELVPPAASSKK
jgi:hypothetical protein